MRVFRFVILLIVVALVSQSTVAANTSNDDDHSTVKLFFVSIPNAKPADPDAQDEMAHAGNLFLPTSELQPARIFIGGDFVGHALSTYVDVKPSFRLPPGTHEFRVECDGCKTFESKLRVLGHGSEQWLVVTLRPTQAKGVAAKASEQTE